MSRAPAFQSQQPHEAKRAITLPPFNTDIPEPDEIEVKENARRFLEHRTIKQGLDAWCGINQANSFENWKRIGAALSVGKQHVLHVTKANAAWGSRYSREFGIWLAQHHFDGMAKSLRSVAIELHENIHAIEQWRTTLTDKQRRRLQGPLQNVRRWRAETAPSDKFGTSSESPTDKRDAPANDDAHARRFASDAWHRFVSWMEALPPDLAAPLWIEAQARAAAFLATKELLS